LLLLLPHPLLTLLLLLLPHLLLRKLPSNIFYIAKKKPPCGGFFSSLSWKNFHDGGLRTLMKVNAGN
jgi:hypothetical protein